MSKPSINGCKTSKKDLRTSSNNVQITKNDIKPSETIWKPQKAISTNLCSENTVYFEKTSKNYTKPPIRITKPWTTLKITVKTSENDVKPCILYDVTTTKTNVKTIKSHLKLSNKIVKTIKNYIKPLNFDVNNLQKPKKT